MTKPATLEKPREKLSKISVRELGGDVAAAGGDSRRAVPAQPAGAPAREGRVAGGRRRPPRDAGSAEKGARAFFVAQWNAFNSRALARLCFVPALCLRAVPWTH